MARLRPQHKPGGGLTSPRGVFTLTIALAAVLACMNLAPGVFHGDLQSLVHLRDSLQDLTHTRQERLLVEQTGEAQNGLHSFREEGEGGRNAISSFEAQQARREEQQAAAAAAAAEAAAESVQETQQGEELAEAAEQAEQAGGGLPSQQQQQQEQQQAAAWDSQASQAAAQQQGDAAAAADGDVQWVAAGAEGSSGGTLEQYHVVMSTSAGVYTEWQSRICYYWYQRAKAEDQHGAMGGFTRLLSGRELDGLENEIPTVLVDPLPPELEQLANGYVVLERPHAFKQWVRSHLPRLPEKYLLMVEPDHVFLRAPPLWASPNLAAAYPFFYIEPAKYPHLVAKFNDKQAPLADMPPVGNSPVQIHRDQLTAVVDLWAELALRIRADKEASETWGWVQEMYGYSLASAQAPGGPIRYELHKELVQQPPWDDSLTSENGLEAYILHYTYGIDFDEEGKFTPGKVGTFHFDKRDFTFEYPPKDLPMPPPGCTNQASVELIRRINEAANFVANWGPAK